jgi:hypothetical protein
LKTPFYGSQIGAVWRQEEASGANAAQDGCCTGYLEAAPPFLSPVQGGAVRLRRIHHDRLVVGTSAAKPIMIRANTAVIALTLPAIVKELRGAVLLCCDAPVQSGHAWAQFNVDSQKALHGFILDSSRKGAP